MDVAEPIPSSAADQSRSTARPGSHRLTSLDIFRGLVILVMTFVNFLSPVKDIPGWAKHMPESVDGFTFVDVVFPAFLFIVGVAIPLALERRLTRGEDLQKILVGIVVRTAGLLFVGVVMVNKGLYSPKASVLSTPWWYLLAMSSIVVLWINIPGKASAQRRRVIRSLQGTALIAMVVLLALFRGEDGKGRAIWLQHSWWGILGLIGWAYLVCSICWLVFRRNSTALLATMMFMFALYIGGRHGMLDWLGPIQKFVNVGVMFGSNAATVMMGILVGNLLLNQQRTFAAKAGTMFLMAVAFIVSGILLRPLHGFNKSAHTESYSLVTGGICCALFAIIFYFVEQRRLGWGNWLVPIGQNALFAYVVPGIIGNSFKVWGATAYLADSGVAGAWSAALLTVLVMVLTWTMSRFDIKLKF